MIVGVRRTKRHCSLVVVSGETVRLHLPLTHHLQGSGTWSNRQLPLDQTNVEPMMSLDHQRDSTATARRGLYSGEKRDPLLSEVERHP